MAAKKKKTTKKKSNKPTRDEVIASWKILNAIMLFVAMRGMWNQQVPEVVKMYQWMQDEFKFTDADAR